MVQRRRTATTYVPPRTGASKVDVNDSTFLTEKELAARWKMQPPSLANQRSQGRGPRYVKIGEAVRYRLSDVIAHERLNGRI